MGWQSCVQFIATCDRDGCEWEYQDGGETLGECIERARAEGWVISFRVSPKESHMRKCFCPDHNGRGGN